MNERTPGDDHLWDGSGTPDPDVERLERLLRPLGAREGRPTLHAAPGPGSPRGGRKRWRWIVPACAAAAALLIAVVAGLRRGDDGAAHPSRDGAPVSADPQVAAGSWIETEDAPREIRLGDVSHVVVAPRTRLQVRRVADDAHHFYLERGTIEASVSADARPRLFQVATDAANCVDLGCRYTLEVDDAGTATVRVTLGQVAFETPDREVFVPAGAEAVARRGAVPGTPLFADASPEVRRAFVAFDASSGSDRSRAAFAAIGAAQTGRDTLAVWHLLQERDGDVVEAALRRIEELAGPCDVPSDGSLADRRLAWKACLFDRCW